MRVLVLNGPNLNLLGKRQPEIYGKTTIADLTQSVVAWGAAMGVEVDTAQSNSESALIELIHDSAHDGIVFNPGALSHTSRALGDAIASVPTPVVEIHVSNVRQREPWRAESVVAAACVRTIYGRGVEGYRDALRHLVNRAALPVETTRYGPHSDNIADVRQGSRGCVVLVHGGFWRQEWERDTMESLAVDLSRRDITTINIEYRRLGSSGGWPASGHDVLTALETAPRHCIGSSTTSIIGHSAGGFLALWAANRRSVDLVVGLGAVTDLARLSASSAEPGAFEAGVLLAAGAPPTVAAPPGTLLVHGGGDSLVDPGHSSRLAGVAQVLTPDTGHFELLDAGNHYWARVVDAVEAII